MIPQAMSCKELVELVTEYLEGTLPSDARARFEAHLARCEGCTHYLEQMRHTIQLVGRLPEEAIPAKPRDELLNLFQHWKGEDG